MLAAMLPKNLALVDDDADFTEYLAQYLHTAGTAVEVFGDSNDLLAHDAPFSYAFYVLDLMLPGIDGVDLIKLLRRRSDAGILVVSGRLGPEVFNQVLTAGADMYLAKPAQFEQVALAVHAVQRRVAATSPTNPPWRLDRRAKQLLAPDGALIDLSDRDLTVLECFAEAAGETVTREALLQRLGRTPADDVSDGLNATIYRLRRRIERATPVAVPLQARSRVGYVFRAVLKPI
jgi:DNA-binding response OmpR family regulator